MAEHVRPTERSDYERMVHGEIPSRVYVNRMDARIGIRRMITPDRDVVAARRDAPQRAVASPVRPGGPGMTEFATVIRRQRAYVRAFEAEHGPFPRHLTSHREQA
jgi:hypothetical protein